MKILWSESDKPRSSKITTSPFRIRAYLPWILFSLSIVLSACQDNNRVQKEQQIGQPKTTVDLLSPEVEIQPTSFAKSLVGNINDITITFWHAWDGETANELETIVNNFNATNEYGIIVDAIAQEGYQVITTVLNTASFSKDSPNLVAGFNYHIITWNMNENVLVDLNPYIQDTLVGLNENTISDFHRVFWEQDVAGDQRLGIPAQRFGQVIYYNSTWAQELGFDIPPETPEELKEQACAAAKANGDGTGGLIISTDGNAIAGWIYAFGGKIEAEGDGYEFNTLETKAAFDFLDDLHAKGCAWEANFLYPNREFASRQGLFYTSSVAGLNVQQEFFDNLNNVDEWTVIPFPSHSSSPVIPIYGVSLAMVASTPKEQLATWMFIKYFIETTNQVMWTNAGENFPLRYSVLDFFEDFSNVHPQWAISIGLLEYGVSAPRVSSWGIVLLVLQDAAKELFRSTEPYNPQLLEDLESTAREVHAFYSK